MDYLAQYKDFEQRIKILLNTLGQEARFIRDGIIPTFELESGANIDNITTPTEELREFVKTTRSIRDYIFTHVDTHLLTIEHIADKILARRAFKERNNLHTASRINVGVTERRSMNKLDGIVKDIGNLNKEDIAKLIQNLKK